MVSMESEFGMMSVVTMSDIVIRLVWIPRYYETATNPYQKMTFHNVANMDIYLLLFSKHSFPYGMSLSLKIGAIIRGKKSIVQR